jgi:hypothetical protein
MHLSDSGICLHARHTRGGRRGRRRAHLAYNVIGDDLAILKKAMEPVFVLLWTPPHPAPYVFFCWAQLDAEQNEACDTTPPSVCTRTQGQAPTYHGLAPRRRGRTETGLCRDGEANTAPQPQPGQQPACLRPRSGPRSLPPPAGTAQQPSCALACALA